MGADPLVLCRDERFVPRFSAKAQVNFADRGTK
jgi:hypothetical protein